MKVSGSDDTLHKMLTTGESDVCGFVNGEKFICKLYSFHKKIYYFIVTLGHTQNVGFLLLKRIVIFIIFVGNFSF